MKDKIDVIYLGPFPKGNVSTIRLLSYLNVFVENGYDVNVYIPSPLKDSSINHEEKGIYNGIHFDYIMGVTWKVEPILLFKLIIYFLGLIKVLFKILIRKPKFVITYDSELLRNYMLSIFSRVFSVNVVMDITEYPKGFFKFSNFRKKLEKFSFFGINKIVSISEELCDFYEGWLKKKTFLLPVSVDPDRYSFRFAVESDDPYLLCMFGTHNRDSIIDTVEGYRIYVENTKSRPLKLYMVGDFDKLISAYSDCRRVLDIVRENSLEDLVVFKGLIRNDDVPEITGKATCLITTPRSFVSGGFPTKLAEYLLTSRPVISTNVGELKNYLIDNENIFFVVPADPLALAERIASVQMNIRFSNLIGQNGREVALKAFNAKTYFNSLIFYIEM